MCVHVSPSCMSVKVSDPPETRLTDKCELPCGCWELNLGPLGEREVLSTPEPSLQPLYSTSCMSYNSHYLMYPLLTYF